MFHGRVLITENKNLAPGYYFLTVLAPEITSVAKPGQFIQVKVSSTLNNDPLLARPISIFSINQETKSISLIYKVIGRGTSHLAEMKQGELLEILGPVGNGFSIPDDVNKIALIAGGVGMPPLFCLTEYIQRLHKKQQLSLFYGGRTANDLLEMDRWLQTGINLFTATEDGSYGRHGLVTELFIEQQAKERFDFVVGCGPQPMLQSVQKIGLAENIAGQLSLEAHMACGVGACLGCTCKTNQGYRRVCMDGPVFPLSEVVW